MIIISSERARGAKTATRRFGPNWRPLIFMFGWPSTAALKKKHIKGSIKAKGFSLESATERCGRLQLPTDSWKPLSPSRPKWLQPADSSP